MQILVVDDTEINLRLMEAVLKPVGYDVVKVALGELSISAAAEQDLDLILMDKEKLEAEGFDGYFSKPIEIGYTLQVIADLLKSK